MEVAVGSELGLWQTLQSDAHLTECVAPGITLLGIADGFGALGRGVPTAALALAAVRDYVRRRRRLGAFGGRHGSPSNLRALLLAALDHANARLYAQSGSHEDFVGSGTSLTVLLIVGHHAIVGHVGDARAYLLRVGRIEPLTADDAMFADAAVPSAKSALPPKPPARGLLWRSLGTQAKLEASIAHVELLAGDQLLLCTDGVHRCVDDDEVGEALLQSESSYDVVARVLSTVRARGNLDNGTLIAARDLLVAAPPRARSGRLDARLRVLIAIVLLLTAAVSFGTYAFRPMLDRVPGILNQTHP